MGLTQGTQDGVSFYFQKELERQSDLSQQLEQVVVGATGTAAVAVMTSPWIYALRLCLETHMVVRT
jgi:hypothetical protein